MGRNNIFIILLLLTSRFKRLSTLGRCRRILIFLLHSSALTSFCLNFSSAQGTHIYLVSRPTLIITGHYASFSSWFWRWMRDFHSRPRANPLLLTNWVLYGFYYSETFFFLCFGYLRKELLPYIFTIDFLLFHHLTSGILTLFLFLLLPLIIE